MLNNVYMHGCRATYCRQMHCPDVMMSAQMGTLGAGNHYAEIQVVDEIFDKPAARKMGIDRVGQVREALDLA